jgi:hydroxymethylbilane synthase
MGQRRAIRAATRRSPLARWQAEHVAALLTAAHPEIDVELVGVDTEVDQRLDLPIEAFGGKGAFAKEIQAAVLDGRADIAVHSAKDLPSVTVEGLVLAAVGATLAGLAHGATVATGSARRRAQLHARRPDLVFAELRGNMATRLTKVPDGGAIVAAAVALERLGLADRIGEILAVDVCIPQAGQGALGIECRIDDEATRALLSAIEHRPSRRRVDAERAFLAELGGDCTLPAGAHAHLPGVQDDDGLVLQAFLAGEGAAAGRLVTHTASGDDPEALGITVARHVRAALGPS